jgi:hypothetical protein
MTGFSAVIGSWKTIAMRAPRSLAEAGRRGSHQLLALQPDRAGRQGELALGEQAHDRGGGDGLAGAGLAHDAQGLAAGDREVDALDGVGAVGALGRATVRARMVRAGGGSAIARG